MTTQAPVLLIGGAGLIGATAARTLRRTYPDLPITLGVRDPAAAAALVADLGGAEAVGVDLSRRDLGINPDARFGAVVVFFKDATLNSLRFAQDRGVGYADISSAAFEIGPQVALAIQRPGASAVVMASNWLAGTSTAVAAHYGAEFDRVDAIKVSALLDDQDIGGAAAAEDYERQTGAGPSALQLRGGRWTWASGDEAKEVFHGVDGRPFEAAPFGNLDVLSLANAFDAPSARFEFAVGETASRLRGEAFSTEIVIEIAGRRGDGREGVFHFRVVHPEGQAPLTAQGVVLVVERLVGLGGQSRLEPGLYLPHTVVDPGRAMAAFRAMGAVIGEA